MEYCVSVAASIAQYFIRQDRAVGFVAYGQTREVIQADRGERQLSRMLETLAVVRAEGRIPFDDVLAAESEPLPRGTTVIAVTPSLNQRWALMLNDLSRRGLRDQKLNRTDSLCLVDSAPVTLMAYTRGARCRSVVGSDYFGVVTSKKGKVFGLRLHATVTVEQLIDEWLLAPAAYPDARVLDATVLDSRDLVLIGDKAYTDAELEARLWDKRRIHLLPLRRDNQKEQWPEAMRRALGRVRHRVETAFSTLTTVFNVQRPRGRSLVGYVIRIATCILAHTLSFFIA